MVRKLMALNREIVAITALMQNAPGGGAVIVGLGSGELFTVKLPQELSTP